MKSILRRAIRSAGVTLHRGPANRFDAMADALSLLRGRRYYPRVIVDVGANVGQWTELARLVWPQAHFHLVEPQRSCAEQLKRFPSAHCTIHNVVVTKPGASTVRMIGTGTTGTTGAFVARDSERAADEAAFGATTLDELLVGRIGPEERALLKLDIEGHEVDALSGASSVLGVVEVLLCETRFFDVENDGRPVFSDLVQFLRDRSFELYDIAALGSRRRDQRLRSGDVIFVRRDSPLAADVRLA